MLQRFRKVLMHGTTPAPGHATPFNGQLLDRMRDDVFVFMHQIGPRL